MFKKNIGFFGTQVKREALLAFSSSLITKIYIKKWTAKLCIKGDAAIYFLPGSVAANSKVFSIP
ncbi:Uncharacterized protein TCM_002755 [Theobroma cacao]|uniref:Uncharacterized protein n=1 Tax=Theobroma cacao TaxID=3641 RepID=A0A061DM89_THECC|nr:Uncharacterized protein TCM_002755 [Theobroma cacao]